MKQLRKTLCGMWKDIVFLTGGALASVGAGCIYFPAGLIVGGVLLMVTAVMAGDDA